MDEQQDKKDPIEVVAEAVAALGEDTAASIATRAGMAYSTVTPKLRALEAAGRAEKFRRDGRTLWRQAADATTTPDPDQADDTGSDAGQPAGDDTTLAQAGPPHPGGDDPQPDEPAHTESAEPDESAGHDGPAPPAPAPVDDPAAQPDQATPTEPASPDIHAADSVDGHGGESTHPDSAAEPAADTDAAAAPAAGKTRRPPGELGRTALRIMQAHPQTVYKVGEMAKLIDQADQGKGYPTASPGAVVLALNTLVDNNQAKQVSDKPATYQLA